MEKRKIGSLEVTVVGVGCDNFGGRIDEPQTRDVIDAAIDAGINFFDTADDYPVVPRGLWGAAEEIMGRVLKGRRDEVVIATKFGTRPDNADLDNATPETVRRSIEDSLRRLQTDHVDLYLLHKPDPNTPITDTLGALNELVEEGKVIEFGCSHFSVDQIREAAIAVPPEGSGFVCVQNELSLLNRRDELDVLPECEATGLSYLPFFPLYNGLLAGGYRRGAPWPEDSRFKDASPERRASVFSDRNIEIIESLVEFAELRGHTILELAFNRLLAHRCLSSVIAGPMTADQVRAERGDGGLDAHVRRDRRSGQTRSGAVTSGRPGEGHIVDHQEATRLLCRDEPRSPKRSSDHPRSRPRSIGASR